MKYNGWNILADTFFAGVFGWNIYSLHTSVAFAVLSSVLVWLVLTRLGMIRDGQARR